MVGWSLVRNSTSERHCTSLGYHVRSDSLNQAHCPTAVAIESVDTCVYDS